MARKSKLKGDNKQLLNSDANGNNNVPSFLSRIPVSVRGSKQIEKLEPSVEKICPDAEISLEKTCLQAEVEQISGEKILPKAEVEPTAESMDDMPPPSPYSVPMRGSPNDEAPVTFPKQKRSSLSCGANFTRFPAIPTKPTQDLPRFPAPVNSIVSYAVQNDGGNESSHEQERLPSFQLARDQRAAHSTSLSSAGSSFSSSPCRVSRPRTFPPPSAPANKSETGTYVNLFYKKKAFDMGTGSLRSTSREQAVAPYTPPTPPPNDQVRFAKVVTEYEIITEMDFEEEEEKIKKLEETEVNNRVTTSNHSTPVSVGSSAINVPQKKSRINGKKESPATATKPSKTVTISEARIPAKSDPEEVDEARKVNDQRKMKKEKTKEKVRLIAPHPPPPTKLSEPPPKMRSKTHDDQCKMPDDDDYNDTPSSESVSNGKLPNNGNISAKISHVILPGHGNPRMAQPPVTSPARKSSTPMESRRPQTPPPMESHRPQPPPTKVLSPPERVCKKCAHLKRLLSQADGTLHYLNELLKTKEKELQVTRNLITSPPSTNSLSRDRATNTSQRQSIIALNPLLAKLLKDNTGHKSPDASAASRNGSTSTTPRGANITTPCAIPKFDLDEFIRKFLRHSILLSEDYSNLTQIDPFEYAQIFRAALAARDCLAQAVKQKLKHGYHTLKRQYEILMSMKSSAEEPLEDAYYLKLVDSHRRFVRFIYYFLKTSIEDVEKFEQNYIPLQRRTPTAYPMKYSKETTMTIDGVHYSGVFIPLSTIQKDELRSKKQKL